ncbi:MAG TPA: anti-sigma F factor [Thermoanaerobacterales bacterium]|nr:anti-sigma F factor [Thermoanaerobacterales bacterium]
MTIKNEMKLEFPSKSQNEAFARITVAAFASQLDPNLEELSDIKTAVSEAVTNSIIHGYPDRIGNISINATLDEKSISIIIEDNGVGMSDIKKAMEPLYTSKPELERSGMGFTIMESFMDILEVESFTGIGTKIKMKKHIQSREKTP